MDDLIAEYKKTLRTLRKTKEAKTLKGDQATLLNGMIRDVAWTLQFMRLSNRPMTSVVARWPKAIYETPVNSGPQKYFALSSSFQQLKRVANDLKDLLQTSYSDDKVRKMVLRRLKRRLTNEEFSLLCWVAQGYTQEEIARLLRTTKSSANYAVDQAIKAATQSLKTYSYEIEGVDHDDD